MSSESRTIRPYVGVQKFQTAINECQFLIGDRTVEGGSRVSLTEIEFLREACRIQMAQDDERLHEARVYLTEALAEADLSPSDVELVVQAGTPKLKMVDIVYARTLDEVPDLLPRLIPIETRPSSMKAPYGGCDLKVTLGLARGRPRAALRPWRKGTWLGRVEFGIRTDLGGVGFLPVRLTKQIREDLGLSPDTMRYASIEEGHSVFDKTVSPEAVKVYVDEDFLDRLAVIATTPIGKQLQRQLFTVAVWAITSKAVQESKEDGVSYHDDVDDFEGSLVHGLTCLMQGRDKSAEAKRQRNESFRELLTEPAKFVSNVEAKLATRRDVLEIFEE